MTTEPAATKKSAAEVLQQWETKHHVEQGKTWEKDELQYAAEILAFGLEHNKSYWEMANQVEDEGRFRKMVCELRPMCTTCQTTKPLHHFLIPPCSKPQAEDLISHGMCYDCWKRYIEELKPGKFLRCTHCKRDLFGFMDNHQRQIDVDFWNYHCKRLRWHHSCHGGYEDTDSD